MPPLQHSPAIGYLCQHNGAGHNCGTGFVVRHAVLRSAQEDVPLDRSMDTCQKMAILRQKCERHAAFPAHSHQKRAARNLAETHDCPQRVDRDAQLRFLFHANGDRFAVLRQVRALGGYVQRVE